MQNQTIIGSEYPKIVGGIIDRAVFSIDILMYDWRWYKDDFSHPLQIFNLKLVRAIKRGVKIRVITNSPDVVDTLNVLGFYAKVWSGSCMLHSKLVLVDNETVVSGSHNLTGKAFTSNAETSIVSFDPETSQRFKEYFNNIW